MSRHSSQTAARLEQISGRRRSIASTASRCISITRSIGSRFSAKPSNAPTFAACSALSQVGLAVHDRRDRAGQRHGPASESYGRPAAMSRLPRLAYPSPSGRNLWLFAAIRSVG